MRNRGQMDVPAVYGTGLVALDVILRSKNGNPSVLTGGTCANVLGILAYLGWRSHPICRIGDDTAAKLVLADLRSLGMWLDLASVCPSARTPIVVEYLTQDENGNGKHRFSLRCPACNSWYPTYQPIPQRSLDRVLPQLKRPSLFFFDRPSRTALAMAKAAADLGAVIAFEPAGAGDASLFSAALDLAHIVKYSHDRLGDTPMPFKTRSPFLVIETRGAEGLRYRSNLSGASGRTWRCLKAFHIARVIDAAGCGDWLSATFLV